MMWLFDFVLHIDTHLSVIISQYGGLVYLIVFLIVFCETGLVVTPILPGDSLLFALGALAARGDINILALIGLLFVAALLGDNVNYWIGRKVGPKLFSGKTFRWLNQDHLHETQEFYKRHGGVTIILARFVPIVRTFAPFVAGIGAMAYRTFITYSMAAAALWIGIGLMAGYIFGNIPFVQHNFSLVVLGIVVVSLIPPAVKFIQSKRRKRVDTQQ